MDLILLNIKDLIYINHKYVYWRSDTNEMLIPTIKLSHLPDNGGTDCQRDGKETA